ncbi:MAG: hypothetical protein JKY94_07245 [Rhodobacteraceae bacterium]|nr:hypothetical protein [Paracoccaceae bacterium]
MHDAVLAIDLGTSAIKAVVFDFALKQCSSASAPITTLRDNAKAEQYPEQWLSAMALAALEAITDARQQGYNINAISFTGHMSTPVFVGKDKIALGPVQTLADQRCAGIVAELKPQQIDLATKITGNKPASHFSLPKILWSLANDPHLAEKTAAILAPKDYLRLQLGGRFSSDASDAYNSLLFDLEKMDWSDLLLSEMNISRRFMPAIRLSTDVDAGLSRGWAEKLGLDAGIPLVTGASDMATAALACGIDNKERIAVTVGTSATVLMACSNPITELVGRVTFHPAALEGLFALGSHFNGGACLDWFHGLLSGSDEGSQQASKKTYADLQALAKTALHRQPETDNPTFLPYLLGSGSPRFNAHERGVFADMSASHDHVDLFRAVIEGITLDLCQTIADFRAHNQQVDHIYAGGGGMKLELWPQLLADISGLAVKVSKNDQTSAKGAAILACKALGVDHAMDSDEIEVFNPDPDKQKIYQMKAQRFRDLTRLLSP